MRYRNPDQQEAWGMFIDIPTQDDAITVTINVNHITSISPTDYEDVKTEICLQNNVRIFTTLNKDTLTQVIRSLGFTVTRVMETR